MSFALVPTESKSNINKAGQILVAQYMTPDPPMSPDKLMWAWGLANKWRACHAYPINTFQATLRRRLKAYGGEPIVAQRLKRMPTIIDKLHRYSTMQLTDMQDIGGIRAVLESVGDVYKLARVYKTLGLFEHVLIREKDYIDTPKDDGYRSIHLIYRYKNDRNPGYDGLQLEMQIRSKLQHLWATAVETMGTFLGQALKSRKGDKEWIDFFAITSSVFAVMEKTPKIERFRNLSRKEAAKEVAAAVERMGALEQMRLFSAAASHIANQGKGSSYHLIILNSLEKRVEVKGFNRESFDQALNEYSVLEKQAAEGSKIEPVLVSAGRIDILRKAYPNFFLDVTGFASIVKRIVDSTRK